MDWTNKESPRNHIASGNETREGATMAIAINSIIIVLELIGLVLCGRRGGWKILQYYTFLSNLIALLSSVLFLLAGEKAAWLRYAATCLLTMTFLVTLCILVPMGAGFKTMMLTDSGLYYHTLCPILSALSYLLWEGHASAWYLPVVFTFVYGMVMLYLNWKGTVDGPYPFFKIKQQSALATIVWMAALTGVIALISLALACIP